MKNLWLVAVYIFLAGASASAEVKDQNITANQVALKVESHSIFQAIGGYEQASAQLQFFDGKCIQLLGKYDSMDRCVIKAFPVTIHGFRLGAGMKFSSQGSYGGTYSIYLANWDGKSVYDLFGNYYGINGAEVDLAMFGLSGLSALGMNSSKVIVSKIVSGYGGPDQGGYGLNIVSLRVLSVWPARSYADTKEEVFRSMVLKFE